MNAYKGLRIEFHILQSFPVSCLNRDDVGSPKSAVIGGVPRARVSSQCWKRHVRLALHGLGVTLACRTKNVDAMLLAACKRKGMDAGSEKVKAYCTACADALTKDTLLFFSESEADAIAVFGRDNGLDAETVIRKNALTKAFKAVHKEYFQPAADGLDIALFGRMAAQVPEINVFAAASFAHAISTHRVDNEIEFFTALDDLPSDEQLTGSAHMGSLEFNAATYYRYVSLDLGQLCETLGGKDLDKAVAAFVKALYIAVPSARQTTQAALRPWDYAHVFVRSGQGMQASFEKPVRAKNGFLEPSITALEEQLSRQEKLSGSLFGKKCEYVFGKDEEFSIDNLADALAGFVRKIGAQG